MKTIWENRYLNLYKKFIREVIDFNPDLIVPVARKSCKLFNSVEDLFREVKDRIYYLDHFKFTNKKISNKKIAIIDDAVNRTSKLFEYRDYFINQGVPNNYIRTYAFIGHQQLMNNPALKCDKNAIISNFVSPAHYKEYLINQSDHLLFRGSYPDIDHLTLEFKLSKVRRSQLKQLWDHIPKLGYRYHLDTVGGIKRFGLHCDNLCDLSEFASMFNLSIEPDFVQKIRFTFKKNSKRIVCTPMIFPKFFTKKNEICSIGKSVKNKMHFELPCAFRGQHKLDKYCYLSLCLFLNSLLMKKFIFSITNDHPDMSIFFNSLKVHRFDMVRYLGETIGHKVSDNVERFVKCDITPMERLLQKVNSPKIKSSISNIQFSRKNVPYAIQNLRLEYKNAVKENNNNPINVKITKPIEYFLQFNDGIHPLIFTEVLDEYCDLGVIVPSTEFFNKSSCWRRTYRTGEDTHDEYAWERSKRILPLAIRTLNQSGVKRMYLEKVMANYCHDFPYHSENYSPYYPEFHCFLPKPSYWGTQTFIMHPVSKQTIALAPLNLSNNTKTMWNDFSTFYKYNSQTNEFISESPLRDLSEYVGNHRIQRDYFLFLKTLKESTGTVDSLNSLSLCRNKDWFYAHIIYNLYRWTQTGSFGSFLKELEQDKIETKYLNFAGSMVESALQKLDCLIRFPNLIIECENIASENPELFNDIWYQLIKPNIVEDDRHFARHPRVQQIFEIINGIKALDGITRIKLKLVNPSKLSKTMEKVDSLAQNEFNVLGIKIDISSFLKSIQNNKEICSILKNVYNSIISKISELSKPIDQNDLENIHNKSNILRMNDYISTTIQSPTKRKRKNIIAFCIKKTKEDSGFIHPKLHGENHIEDGILTLKIIDDYQRLVVISIDIRENKIIKYKEV